MSSVPGLQELLYSGLDPRVASEIRNTILDHESRIGGVETGRNGAMSVTSFVGVLGDGVHDDTVGIQAAIDAAYAANVELFFPPGIYRVTRAVVAGVGQAYCLRGGGTRATRLRGAGIGVSVIIKDVTLAGTPNMSVSLLLFNSATGCLVEGITLDGNKQSSGYDQQFEHQAGLFVQSCSGLVVRDAEIKNCGGDAVQLYLGTSNTRLSGSSFHHCNRHGVSLTSGDAAAPVYRVNVSTCQLYANAGEQIDSEPGGTGYSDRVRIVDCLLDSAGVTNNPAVVAFGARHWTILGCEIRGSVECALSSSIIIADNTIEDYTSGGGAVFLYEQNSRIVVIGNDLLATHAVAGASCMRVEALNVLGQQSDDVLIAANTIDCTNGPNDIIGVGVKTAGTISIKSNTIIGKGVANASSWGIHLRATATAQAFDNAQVDGNTIKNFGSKGLVVNGNGAAVLNYLGAEKNVFIDTAGTMTVALALDNDGTHALQSWDIVNNKIRGGVTTLVQSVPAGGSALVAATATNTGWMSK